MTSAGDSTQVLSEEGAAEDLRRRVVEANCQLFFGDSIRDLEFSTNECQQLRRQSEARETSTIRSRVGDDTPPWRIVLTGCCWMLNTPPWRIVLKVRYCSHRMLVLIPIAVRLDCLMECVTAASGLERSSVHFELVSRGGASTGVVLSGAETPDDLDLTMEDEILVYNTAAASLECPALRGRSRSPRLRARDRQALDDMSRPRASWSTSAAWNLFENPWIDITRLT